MKVYCAALFLLIGLSCPIFAQTAKGNWATVEAIPANAQISIVAEHTYQCSMDYSTDTDLSCHARNAGGMPLQFARTSIRKISIEHVHRSTAIGAIAGAGLGVGIGLGTGGSGALTRPATAVGLGAAFGLLGGYIDRHFSLTRGTVVYQR